MLKVFLVEDEIVMREGIKNNIEWEKEGFEFSGEASDGELAYPMIQKLKPDIIITDIKMPFMDGLELSRLVKKEMPQIKILVLSGYNEFDYAKQAISIGITDYLLKPISSVKLLEAVKQVAAKIDEENEQQEYMERFRLEMLENEHIGRQKFFNDLISNKLSMTEIIEKGKKLHIDLSAQIFEIVLLGAWAKGENAMVYSEDLVTFSEQLENALEDETWVISFNRAAEGVAFLLLGETEEEILKHTDDLVDCIQTAAEKSEKLEYFGGVGKIVQRLRELPESFEEANKAYSYRYLVNTNRIVRYDNLGKINLLEDDNIDLATLDIGKIDRKILKNFLHSGSKEEIAHFVDDYFEGLGTSNIESLLFRQYITMDMYFCSVAFIEELGKEADLITEKCGDFRGVASVLVTVSSTKEYLISIISEAITLRDGISSKKYSGLLNSAMEYIMSHYDQEDVSLNLVAAHVNMSPSHFSTIFSQEMDYTFIEYLTNVRMEKAKGLLMCSNMKSSEVGYAVGYKDSHYFSYLFKKTQGCTPKEFRMRGKE